MEKNFSPDYRRIIAAAENKAGMIPLYEHNISDEVMGSLLNKDMKALNSSANPKDLDEYFKLVAGFHESHGYDTYSFEGCFTELIQQGQGLMGHAGSLIKSGKDLETYPWENLSNMYFKKFGAHFDAVRRTLPIGMKIAGGVGNGMFETIQDFVPFTELCYLEADDPGLFGDLWDKAGTALLETWRVLLSKYKDIFAVCRFGDDLGFKATTLLNPQTIRKHVLPWYQKIIELIHSFNKPFLLHSCGQIFDVMDEIIDTAKIDAKHSNEDVIAPMEIWLDRYGDRIGNFGGIDMDILCREDETGVRAYVEERFTRMSGYKGIAVGSGNQIANYVPPQNFTAMVETIRRLRGF